MAITSFVANTKAKASEVNGNFSEIILKDSSDSRTGILSGLVLSEQTTPSLTADLTAGSYVISGTSYSSSSAKTVTFPSADATNPRWDLVSIDSSGTVTVTSGTAASNPALPTLPIDNCPIAAVWRAATDDIINNQDIFLWRNNPTSAVEWTLIGYYNLDTSHRGILRIPIITNDMKLDISLRGGGTSTPLQFYVDDVSAGYEYTVIGGGTALTQVTADTNFVISQYISDSQPVTGVLYCKLHGNTFAVSANLNNPTSTGGVFLYKGKVTITDGYYVTLGLSESVAGIVCVYGKNVQ